VPDLFLRQRTELIRKNKSGTFFAGDVGAALAAIPYFLIEKSRPYS
jgi:hypothetical protein